ncbi:hypothetical protein GYMLUDRAFT_256815 [Collybiopsis luxurians FD-317 M1]|nr:hypothetical protein GYMLUDRAFT_256815 [Collybiopsis luxurians FD-317 M1]
MSTQTIPTTVQNPITLDLTASYGVLIIAAYLSCALWGINVMQAYIYYWNYPDDPWPTKSLIAFLLYVIPRMSDVAPELFIHRLRAVDTAHKILVTIAPWSALVQNWGRVSAIIASPPEALHEAWVGSIIIIVVQMYYLRRIAKFASTTRHRHTWYFWLFFMVMVALSILQILLKTVNLSTGSCYAYCVFSINKKNIFIPINLDLKRVGLVSAAVVDLVIAAAMIMLLKDSDSIDGGRLRPSKRISRTIRRLMVIIVNTGLVTAVVTIISLILDETASGTNFWTAMVQYPQCSIYFSTLLANLNARHYIRGPGDDITVSNIEDMRFASEVEARGGAETGLTSRHIISQMGASEGDSSGPDTSYASHLEKYTGSERTLSQGKREMEVV